MKTKIMISTVLTALLALQPVIGVSSTRTNSNCNDADQSVYILTDKPDDGSHITATESYDNGKGFYFTDDQGGVSKIINGKVQKLPYTLPVSHDQYNSQAKSIKLLNATNDSLLILIGGSISYFVGADKKDVYWSDMASIFTDKNGAMYGLENRTSNIYSVSVDENSGRIRHSLVSNPSSDLQQAAQDSLKPKTYNSPYPANCGTISVNPQDICYASDGIIGLNDGRIAVIDPLQVIPLNVECKYISPAFGSTSGSVNENIYELNITGQSLSYDDIFNQGYNGIRYEITTDSKPDITVVYPICGFRYLSDDGRRAVIHINPIKIQWQGPANDDGTHKIFVTQFAHKPDGTEVKMGDTKDFTLINTKNLEFKNTYLNYNIMLKSEDYTAPQTQLALNTLGEKTDAVPFLIQIQDTTTKQIIPNDATHGFPYDHLAFFLFSSDSTPVILPKPVVECNPDANHNSLTILPADSVEKTNGTQVYVKYGRIRQNTIIKSGSYGKIYYLFLNNIDRTNKFIVKPVLLTLDTKNTYTIFDTSHGPQINAKIDDIQTAPGCSNTNNYPPSTDQALNLGLADNSSHNQIYVSNWEGDTSGQFSGYIDYILDEQYRRGVYYYLPEGLNTRTENNRVDPTTLTVGYYLKPQALSYTSPFYSPLWASGYTAFTNYPCSKDLRTGVTLQALIFDQHGRHPGSPYSFVTNHGGTDDLWKKSEEKDDSYAKIRVRLCNTKGCVPVVMSSSSDNRGFYSGIRAPGIFVPPNNNEYDFLTDTAACIDQGNDGQYSIDGFSIASPNQVFKNILDIREYTNRSFDMKLYTFNPSNHSSYQTFNEFALGIYGCGFTQFWVWGIHNYGDRDTVLNQSPNHYRPAQGDFVDDHGGDWWVSNFQAHGTHWFNTSFSNITNNFY